MCPVCRARPAEVGVLCEECRDELSSPIRIMPEQIQLHSARPDDGGADRSLGPAAPPRSADADRPAGRRPGPRDPRAVGVAPPRAAHARRRRVDGARSRLGERHVPRRQADRRPGRRSTTAIACGSATSRSTSSTTSRGCRRRARPHGDRDDRAVGPDRLGDDAASTSVPLDERSPRKSAPTSACPIMSFKLHEPTGGGGGLIEVDGKQVQLTTTQFELMALMIRRMAGRGRTSPSSCAASCARRS